MLKDFAYFKETKDGIKNITEEYSVMLYDRKEIHSMPKSDIQFTISDQPFLDVLFIKIISKTISNATLKTRKALEQGQQSEERQIF